jgi:malic enzyme
LRLKEITMASDGSNNKRTSEPIEVRERGAALLHNPLLNKGTAFTREERKAFDLEGLLPDNVSSMAQQVERNYGSIERKTDPLEKYIGLVALQDRNETLFYRMLSENVEEFLPIVYTPTVGLATQRYSRIFRRARGVWITPEHRGRIKDILTNAECCDVRLIVVTDGERILGLGDLGAGGMGIPIGKLALYTVGAGIHPSRTLPVCLDVGTDNESLLQDDLYIGWRHPRCRGEDYDSLVDEFVSAVKTLYPHALLQWEDFKKVNAMRILERYRHQLLSFNDDIQGTAAVAVAGVLAGVRATEVPLADHRFVVLGAGAAGVGIAEQIRTFLAQEGLTQTEIAARLALLDSRGLLIEGREYREGDEYKKGFSVPLEVGQRMGLDGREGYDLADTVRALRPSVLIGTSGQAGAFGEEIICMMAEAVDRPMIFPFSNPTANSEAKPEDLIKWTQGRAVVATGSPFDPVEHEGRIHRIGQGNNVFVFPGVGLGALSVAATEVTDEMFTIAAKTLASQVTAEELAAGQLYPDLSRLREVSAIIAEAVANQACESGCAPAATGDEIASRVESWVWDPVYPTLVPA